MQLAKLFWILTLSIHIGTTLYIYRMCAIIMIYTSILSFFHGDVTHRNFRYASGGRKHSPDAIWTRLVRGKSKRTEREREKLQEDDSGCWSSFIEIPFNRSTNCASAPLFWGCFSMPKYPNRQYSNKNIDPSCPILWYRRFSTSNGVPCFLMARIGSYLKRVDYAFGSFLFTRFFTTFVYILQYFTIFILFR